MKRDELILVPFKPFVIPTPVARSLLVLDRPVIWTIEQLLPVLRQLDRVVVLEFSRIVLVRIRHSRYLPPARHHVDIADGGTTAWNRALYSATIATKRSNCRPGR